jgi:hypothetical protein
VTRVPSTSESSRRIGSVVVIGSSRIRSGAGATVPARPRNRSDRREPPLRLHHGRPTIRPRPFLSPHDRFASSACSTAHGKSGKRFFQDDPTRVPLRDSRPSSHPDDKASGLNLALAGSPVAD